MKKYISTILSTLFISSCLAATPDTVVIDNTKLIYQKSLTNQSSAKGLIIYLHGGVSQFKGKEQLISLSAEELLEGNREMLPVLQEKSYDIIMPIAFNEYNWLEPGGEQFIDKLLEIYKPQYRHIYIAGFSDGGTGAFRFFYNHPEKYDGVMIFNGYPQLNNYYKKVDHFKAIGKNIIYLSTTSDKTIPYEFLLIEFRRQQMLNKNTYFILRNGGHDFTAYKKNDFELCLKLLEKANDAPDKDKYLIYPPIDGLVVDGTIKETYSFRKKTGKAYSMAATEYARDDKKAYSLLLKNSETVVLQPVEATEKEARNTKAFDFNISINGETATLQLNNWLAIKTW